MTGGEMIIKGPGGSSVGRKIRERGVFFLDI